MVRKNILSVMATITLSTATAAAGVQDANTDLAWSDIGDSIINVQDEVKVQRDYDSISQNEGLFQVGSFIRLVQDINLRKAPGAEGMGPLLKGQEYQILEIKIDASRKRYYRVKSERGMGYIYAGTKATYDKWTKQIWSSDDKKIMALAGDLVKVKRKKGLKISTAPSAESFYSIPKGAQVQVESVKQIEDGRVFYKVKYKSKSGYAYFGDAEALASGKTWAEVY
jgi:hypothetical protein